MFRSSDESHGNEFEFGWKSKLIENSDLIDICFIKKSFWSITSNVKYENDKSSLKDIEDYEDFTKYIQKGGLTVCFFTKSTSSPSKYFEPIFQHISREMALSAKFIRVDCDWPKLNKIARHENVRTFPVSVIYLYYK